MVKQLITLLPEETIVYFGDTARIPYGSKSVEVVKRFALKNSCFLLEKGLSCWEPFEEKLRRAY